MAFHAPSSNLRFLLTNDDTPKNDNDIFPSRRLFPEATRTPFPSLSPIPSLSAWPTKPVSPPLPTFTNTPLLYWLGPVLAVMVAALAFGIYMTRRHSNWWTNRRVALLLITVDERTPLSSDSSWNRPAANPLQTAHDTQASRTVQQNDDNPTPIPS